MPPLTKTPPCAAQEVHNPLPLGLGGFPAEGRQRLPSGFVCVSRLRGQFKKLVILAPHEHTPSEIFGMKPVVQPLSNMSKSCH